MEKISAYTECSVCILHVQTIWGRATKSMYKDLRGWFCRWWVPPSKSYTEATVYALWNGWVHSSERLLINKSTDLLDVPSDGHYWQWVKDSTMYNAMRVTHAYVKRWYTDYGSTHAKNIWVFLIFRFLITTHSFLVSQRQYNA